MVWYNNQIIVVFKLSITNKSYNIEILCMIRKARKLSEKHCWCSRRDKSLRIYLYSGNMGDIYIIFIKLIGQLNSLKSKKNKYICIIWL